MRIAICISQELIPGSAESKKTGRTKKTNPFIGALLFVISIVLTVLTGPLGLIYGLFYKLFTAGFSGIGEFLLKIAISVDQLGNVIMQHLLNALWINKYGYKFGNRDETISSVIGKNKKLGALTSFGRFIDAILDRIDPNHSLNSIDYYVEPSDDIAEQLSWIYTRDRKILCLRDQKDQYCIPSVSRNQEDSDGETLFKMARDYFDVDLDIGSLQLEQIFLTALPDSKKYIRNSCYRGKFTGSIANRRHMVELCWLGLADKDAVSETDRKVFEYLSQKGELS